MSNVRALPTAEPEPYVTKREFAQHLSVSVRTVETWMSDGMPHEKWGPRIVRIKTSTALQWVREHARNAA